MQQVREEDMARVRDGLRPSSRSRPSSRRSSPICRRGWRASHLIVRARAPATVAELARDRPARDPGAAAGRDRSGPARQCRRAGASRRRDPHTAERASRRERLAAEISAFAAEPAKSLYAMARSARAALGRARRRRAAGRSGGESRAGNLAPTLAIFGHGYGHISLGPVGSSVMLGALPAEGPGTMKGKAMMKLPREIGPIHFVGIGGIGMSGIAEVLINLGYTVQGSDASDNANRQAAARQGRQRFGRPRRRERRRCRRRGGVDRDQARQSRTRWRRASGACRWCGAPRCWRS